MFQQTLRKVSVCIVHVTAMQCWTPSSKNLPLEHGFFKTPLIGRLYHLPSRFRTRFILYMSTNTEPFS